MEHRFSCPKTCPQTGWPKPPAIASKALRRISDRRSNILRSHGMLAVRLPPRSHHQDGQFAWLVAPDHNDPCLTNATWYCDGSMLNGKWQALRATGFGIAVVSLEGDLLAYGLGWPPTWCSTAAAAEAWALQTVLRECPFPPQMRTDCMSLLTTARLGSAKATHHSRPSARIWKTISETLGVDISTLVQGGKLAWVPAHQSLQMVGETKLSNGCRLTVADWRANRLVDALAKAAASELQASKDTLAFLASAEAAAGHAAALLGVVTHAANNFTEVETHEDGTTSKRILRDSVGKPKAKRARAEVVCRPHPATATMPSPTTHVSVAPWRPPSATTLAKKRRVETDAVALAASIERIGSGMTGRSHGLTGKQRLDALSSRLADRRRPWNVNYDATATAIGRRCATSGDAQEHPQGHEFHFSS